MTDDSYTGGRVRSPTTRDGYPDFRSVEKPDDAEFDIRVRDCGCRRRCGGTRWSASVEIAGELWTLNVSTHYPYVMVHRDHIQKRKYSVTGRNALERAFWRDLAKLGYDGERSLHTDNGRLVSRRNVDE